MREFLINHSTEVIEALAGTLGAYKGKDAINILLKLCTYENDDCREASARSLLEILKQDALVYLNKFKDDKIMEIVEEYKNDNLYNL